MGMASNSQVESVAWSVEPVYVTLPMSRSPLVVMEFTSKPLTGSSNVTVNV